MNMKHSLRKCVYTSLEIRISGFLNMRLADVTERRLSSGINRWEFRGTKLFVKTVIPIKFTGSKI